MEQKGILMGALGVGVGVGIGLASGHTMSLWAGAARGVTAELLQQEMMRLVVHGRSTGVTFHEFPYFLSEQTRVLLTSAAYVHLKQADFSLHTRNLSPASRAILLSGPTELYQQMLAKALANYFEAKLLLLDVTNFSLKIQSKYATSNNDQSFKRSMSATALEKVSCLFGTFSVLPQRVECTGSLRRQSSCADIQSRTSESASSIPKHRRNASASANIGAISAQSSLNPAPLRHKSGWAFSEKLFIQCLYQVLTTVSKSSPIILYIRDADSILQRSPTVYLLFQKLLGRLSGPVLILGSRLSDSGNDYREVDEKLRILFPYNIAIKPPVNDSHFVNWTRQLEEDMKMLQYQDNRNHIIEVLTANDLECDDLDSICLADTTTLSNYIEEIVVLAISYHLMNCKDPFYRNGKLVISSKRSLNAYNAILFSCRK